MQRGAQEWPQFSPVIMDDGISESAAPERNKTGVLNLQTFQRDEN